MLITVVDDLLEAIDVQTSTGAGKLIIRTIGCVVVLLCCGELCLKLKLNALVYLNQIVSFDLDVVMIVVDAVSLRVLFGGLNRAMKKNLSTNLKVIFLISSLFL